VLNGQGGDEAFSGYAWFYPVVERFVRETYGPDFASEFQRAHVGRPSFPRSSLENFYRIFFSRRRWIEAVDGGALACLGVRIDDVLGWAPVNYYLNDELDWSGFREQEFMCRELLPLLLRQEDRLAMWFSIESRVPFLDHTFVEWVGKLSPTFLMQDGYLKYPLRVLFPDLPPEVRYNVAKRGFWEHHSQMPRFRHIARHVVLRSPFLSQRIHDVKAVDRLSTDALWRLFQLAILVDVGSREDAVRWVAELRKGLPRLMRKSPPWMRRVHQRAGSVLDRVL
jgi:asparagine synthase (glutamine-hydrolysing)